MGGATIGAIVVAATLLEITSYTMFARDIARGRARPSRMSWLIWTPLAWLFVAGCRDAGADATLYKLTTTAIGVSVVAAMAVRWGDGGRSRTDQVCLVLTIVGVAAWWRTDDPALGLALFIGADLAAVTPTLRHAWLRPDEESLRGWALTVAASALNLLAVPVDRWELTAAGFGVWGVVVDVMLINLAVLSLLARPRLTSTRPAVS